MPDNCKNCIANYNSKCVAKECKGAIIRLACNPKRYKDDPSLRRKAYEIALITFEEDFKNDNDN